MDERRLRPRCRYPFWRLKFVRMVGVQDGKTVNRKFGAADWFCPNDGTYYGPNGDNVEPLFEPDEYLPPELQPPYQPPMSVGRGSSNRRLSDDLRH